MVARTRRLISRSNQTLAELRAHLAEVEARGIHRLRACASLPMPKCRYVAQPRRVPPRYTVMFTASQEDADLIERAQDLCLTPSPIVRSKRSVRALRLLVERLERKKYGRAANRPRQMRHRRRG